MYVVFQLLFTPTLLVRCSLLSYGD